MTADMKWTILGPAEPTTRGETRVRARCECGTERDVLAKNIKSGASPSCGCVSRKRFVEATRKHGMSGTPLYQSWQAMIERCHNPKHRNYRHYGARGISVCPEWRESFESFYAHVGDRPEGRTLDRIDNDGNYEPGNVRWATASQQVKNRRLKSKCKWGHSLEDEANVRIEKMNGSTVRRCLTCRRRVEEARRRPIDGVTFSTPLLPLGGAA